MNFCPNFLCFLMICNVPQRSSFVICEGKENVRKKVFYNFFQFNRNPPTQIEILKFKMAFSIKNIEIGNLTRWNQIITISQLTRLSVRIKNPRWSKKSDNSLVWVSHNHCSLFYSNNIVIIKRMIFFLQKL